MNKRFFTKLSITHFKPVIPAILLANLFLTSTAQAATINTANPGTFVSSIAIYAVGIGGGFALLLLIYGGLMYSLSKGDPDKITEAQQIITNALGGLALIVFATLILKIVGKDIFNLPGFPNLGI